MKKFEDHTKEDVELIKDCAPVIYYRTFWKCNRCGNIDVKEDDIRCNRCGSYDIIKIDE